MKLNEKGLPDLTPELIQEARDVVAVVTAFYKKTGVKHIIVEAFEGFEPTLTLFGPDIFDREKGRGIYYVDMESDEPKEHFIKM